MRSLHSEQDMKAQEGSQKRQTGGQVHLGRGQGRAAKAMRKQVPVTLSTLHPLLLGPNPVALIKSLSDTRPQFPSPKRKIWG